MFYCCRRSLLRRDVALWHPPATIVDAVWDGVPSFSARNCLPEKVKSKKEWQKEIVVLCGPFTSHASRACFHSQKSVCFLVAWALFPEPTSYVPLAGMQHWILRRAYLLQMECISV